MNVLIIDEAESVRVRLAEALRELDGLEVGSFSPRSRNCIEDVRECRADVVVVDIHMGPNGLDVLRALKRGSNAPVVIALSTTSTPQYRSACLRAGAEYFFDKLHEQELLVETIQQLKCRKAAAP